MPQSLAKLHLHLVFSTKHRSPWLGDTVREDLHAYAAAVLRREGCPVVAINSVEDHIHLLLELSRTQAICNVVEALKIATSKWIKTRGLEYSEFARQAGYGVFAVSASHIATVCAYIARQREHHARHSFQDEYRGILERHRVGYDEQFVWD